MNHNVAELETTRSVHTERLLQANLPRQVLLAIYLTVLGHLLSLHRFTSMQPNWCLVFF